jgi:hypothetical protein
MTSPRPWGTSGFKISFNDKTPIREGKENW